MTSSWVSCQQFAGRLLQELVRDGGIDQALAAARKEMGLDWWVPVLWLRWRDGRLWRNEERSDWHLPDRETFLHALLHDHSWFIKNRLEAFVGREVELDEVRYLIANRRSTGGYVTITGHAGQGKSSVISKLVADAIMTEGYDFHVIYHFIPFSPGPDHQVGLLRNLIARLCLKYNLSTVFVATDSRPALRDYFASALRHLTAQGHQETIYIDGLDQIEEDANGVRDLSFLPENPPSGIVFVLGTRPNDTLRPLELRKPQREYWLPALSRTDFDLLLAHRGVKLTPTLIDRFYTTMQENALYLDLVAKELREHTFLQPEQIFARIADNPENVFSLTIERLRRDRQQWRAILKPILGLLLATRAPLSKGSLRTLLRAEDEDVRDGLDHLGGLLQQSGEGRYALFHLKLMDYLRQNTALPDKEYIFTNEEESRYHKYFCKWCENDKGGLKVIWKNTMVDVREQERREYARQHYIFHLAKAGDGRTFGVSLMMEVMDGRNFVMTRVPEVMPPT